MRAEANDFNVNLGDTIYSDSKCKEQQGGIGDDVTLDQYRADHANQITYDNWRNLRGGMGTHWLPALATVQRAGPRKD